MTEEAIDIGNIFYKHIKPAFTNNAMQIIEKIFFQDCKPLIIYNTWMSMHEINAIKNQMQISLGIGGLQNRTSVKRIDFE